MSRIGAWLAFLAIWVQAVLPAVHHPADMSSGQLAFGTGHNLCLAPGSEIPGPIKAPAHKLPPCPICQAAHAIGPLVPTASPHFAIARRCETAFPGQYAVTLAIRQPRQCAQARAPPVKI